MIPWLHESSISPAESTPILRAGSNAQPSFSTLRAEATDGASTDFIVSASYANSKTSTMPQIVSSVLPKA